MPFAAIVPIGPGPLDLWRGIRLIESLLRWEPQLGYCAILDDSSSSRGIEHLSLIPPTCRVLTLTTPLNSRRNVRTWVGQLSANILRALAWIQKETDADFALRIDADALVINGFCRKIADLLANRPAIGVAGTIGLSCNPVVRQRQNPRWQPRVLRAYCHWPMARRGEEDVDVVDIPTFGPITISQRRSFDCLRPHVFTAVTNGYTTHEYCQGGACVVSRRMLDLMATAGYFETSDCWSELPFMDDGVLAMYACAVGLQLYDFSQPGEPFALQHVGLAYPPHILAGRGCSLIHSVKNDPSYSEHFIRSFFGMPANSGVTRVLS